MVTETMQQFLDKFDGNGVFIFRIKKHAFADKVFDMIFSL